MVPPGHSALQTGATWAVKRRLPVIGEAGALRSYHAAPPEPCASCPLRAVCRGGCQVVSLHEVGALAPDPECPRVLTHRAAAAAAP